MTTEKNTEQQNENEQPMDNQPAESTESLNANDELINDEQTEESTSQTESLTENDSQLNKHIDKLQAQLSEAEKKAEENMEIALRAKAEMENIRRRSEAEIDKSRKFAVEKIANELLPVKDSLELGIKAAEELDTEDEAINTVIEGMQMTLQQMNSAMTKSAIDEVCPEIGDAFDPETHQAMSMIEAEGSEANSIVSVFQKGYTLNNRLLRPAMVIVAK